jgi:hypothetical protein
MYVWPSTCYLKDNNKSDAFNVHIEHAHHVAFKKRTVLTPNESLCHLASKTESNTSLPIVSGNR